MIAKQEYKLLKFYVYISHDFNTNMFSLIYKEVGSIVEYVIKDSFLTSAHAVLFLMNYIKNLADTNLYKIKEETNRNSDNDDLLSFSIEFKEVIV